MCSWCSRDEAAQHVSMTQLLDRRVRNAQQLTTDTKSRIAAELKVTHMLLVLLSNSVQAAGQASVTICSKTELKPLRALLLRNSKRMQTTNCQSHNLSLDATNTHWMAQLHHP